MTTVGYMLSNPGGGAVLLRSAPHRGKAEKMQARGKYLHHESNDYDFNDDSGRRVAGTSHKLALLPEGQMPITVKLSDSCHERLVRSGLKFGTEVEVTYEVRAGKGGQPQLGKVIEISPVRQAAAAS